jgi:hypothetical protein
MPLGRMPPPDIPPPCMGVASETHLRHWDRSGARAVRGGKESSQPEGQDMDDRIVKSPQEASQGQKPGVTRYVLTVGLVLVVILFIVAYFIAV